MSRSTRRRLLAGAAMIVTSGPALGRTVSASLPWAPNIANPPALPRAGGWLFLTPPEAAMVEAIVDRLIPEDELGPGGKTAGCAVFIDRQLAGPYGNNDGLYNDGPYPPDPLPSQGMQTPLTPREQYRQGLAALSAYCRAHYADKDFQDLADADKDAVLHGLENGEITLSGFSGKMLFGALLTNTKEGFFADPIYGGNKDMAGWKLVGFPGTRYDYRDVMQNPNKPYTLPPVGLKGRAPGTGTGTGE